MAYSSEVEIYPEHAAVAAELNALKRDDAGERLAELCLSRLPELGGDLAFTPPEIARLTPVAVDIVGTYGLRVTTMGERSGLPGGISFAIDLLGCVKDRTTARLWVMAIGCKVKARQRNAVFARLVRGVVAKAL